MVNIFLVISEEFGDGVGRVDCFESVLLFLKGFGED